jgi:hypothetical protein
MTDVPTQLRLSRCAPPWARAVVPHVLATTLHTDAFEIVIGDHARASLSTSKIKDTAPRCRQPLAVATLFATVLEPTSPYRPRLRRCT